MKFDMYCDCIKVATPDGEKASVSPESYPYIFRLFTTWSDKLWELVTTRYSSKFNDSKLDVFIKGDSAMYFTVEFTDEDTAYPISKRDKNRLFKMYDLYYKRQFSYSAFKRAVQNMAID